MNKYIRTENEIFKIDTNIYNQVFVVNSKGEWFEISYVEKDIIKQADTIEELCDEFVLHNDSVNKLWLYETYDLLNEYLREGINHKYIIYGAIWTDKGLIYVAKMNNKGGLELI